jgi:ribosomal protein L28
MCDKTNEEHSNDEELAPMVDGLSGALCIFILITTVFMISGIDTVVTGGGLYFTGENVSVNYDDNTIYFESVISLPKEDYDKITSKINSNSGNKITFEAFTSDMTEAGSLNTKRKLIYNLLELKKQLNIENRRITLKVSETNFCNNAKACIRWSVE